MEAGKHDDRFGCAFILIFSVVVILGAEVLAWWINQ